MSKELSTLEQSSAIVETASDRVIKLEDISLTLIGGGESPVAL